MLLEEALTQLTQQSRRNFAQSFDLIINLKNIDLKKPENKFSKDILLPHGRGKDIEVEIISDRLPGAITKTDIEKLSKKEIKYLSKKYGFFVCEAPLMPLVGKVLGRYLGPKGKMPRLLPPTQDVNALVDEMKKSVRINVATSPTIHVIVGTEKMRTEQVKENILQVVEDVKKALPKGEAQIKNILVKLTMNKPIKVELK
jgi:large subunit ribosomal protein L1